METMESLSRELNQVREEDRKDCSNMDPEALGILEETAMLAFFQDVFGGASYPGVHPGLKEERVGREEAGSSARRMG